ncbi:hypothetical protein QFC19_003067 [Naganishia cerealis]|uniref:Uncharacterized protein n=1 Tax=Naganishia cerealis TaxID=610337 RepID=A0ACC2W6L4_9TREE|nr:hypothetical protein QFC19_003067 [Naganishia cerealis]
MNSPARPNADRSRAQSTVPAAPGGEYFPSAQTQQGHQIGQAHPQIRKSQSGVNLRGIEGGSPAPTRSQGSTAGMKTEYVDNLKFEVLNGSPVRNCTDKRQKGFSRPGKGKRASYHHTAEGIPVPPPLLPEDGFSPDLQDKEYDFLHDAFQTSRNGDLIDGSFQHGYQTSSIGTASSNSSFGSRLFDKNSKPDRMEKNKPKRSSVFSTKTKSSKKDGYTTGDESSFRTAVSGKGKKDSKRMSYTFGQTFSKSKTPSIATEHPPLPGTRMNEAGSASVKHRSDDLPVTMAVFLRDAKTFEVDVDRVKRLRLLLGSESTRIMHYGKNGIWNLADVDPETIKPRAPNGASAGVEFEAMRYLTSHFKLINTLTRTLIEQDLAKDGIRKDMRKGEACRFHSEMMFSGMDRILCVSMILFGQTGCCALIDLYGALQTVRKASTDLYPEFHLELARYIKLARDAEYDLPYVIKALITPPPQPYRRSALTSTGQQYGGQTSQHRHQNQHNYRSMQLLDTANGDCTVQSSQWLPTPTEKGDFDFQI